MRHAQIADCRLPSMFQVLLLCVCLTSAKAQQQSTVSLMAVGSALASDAGLATAQPSSPGIEHAFPAVIPARRPSVGPVLEGGGAFGIFRMP